MGTDQKIEPAQEGADEETLLTDTDDENANGGTSDDGEHEDADALKKRLADKDTHITNLEKENRALKTGKTKKTDETDEDLTDWKIMNADDIKMAGKEYQDEVAFFKSQGIKVTQVVLERALTNAKAKKGLSGKSDDGELKRQAETSEASQGETRRSKSKLPQLTEQQKKLGLTPEKIAEIDAQMAEERKALGLK